MEGHFWEVSLFNGLKGGYPDFFLEFFTWAHLPYKAVLKSVHRTASVCSSIRTFFFWIKTANGGSSTDTCQNCKPWQFYGHFSEFMCIVAMHPEDFA